MRVIIHNGKWVVMANWLGAERIIFSSENVFECIRFVKNNS